MPNTRSRGGRFWRSAIIRSHTRNYTDGHVESEITLRFPRPKELKPKDLDKIAAEFRRYLTHIEEYCRREHDPTRILYMVHKAWRKIPAHDRASASIVRKRLRESGKEIADHQVRRALTVIYKAIAQVPRDRMVLSSLPIDKASQKRLIALTEHALKPGLERLR